MKSLKKLFNQIFAAFGIGKPKRAATPRRVCKVCNLAIRRKDKYFFTDAGVQHRDCNNPDGSPEATDQARLI